VDHDVAGATFMAAGGSAPELFTSLVGTFISKSQVGFGAIVGSAVFNVLFVIGMCAIFSSGLLQLTWWPFARDVIYYGFSLLMLTVFFGVISPNVIEAWEAAILLALYACYVLLMYYSRPLQNWFTSKFMTKRNLLDEDMPLPMVKFRVGLLKLLGSIDSEAPYVDIVGAYMVEKIAGSAEKTFRKIDADNNGSLDRAELRRALIKLRIPKEKVDQDVDDLMQAADTNEDGVVSLEEFSVWYVTQKSRAKNRIAKLFKKYDKNENGYLDKMEFGEMITAVNGSTPSKDFCEKTYLEVKATCEMGVTLKEFSKWYRKTLFSTYRKPKISREMPVSESISSSQLGVDEKVDEIGDGSLPLNQRESLDVGGDEYLEIGYPVHEGWKSKLRWAMMIPVVFPLWLTLFDVRRQKYSRFYYLTFLGSIAWLAFFSVLMVWWTTIVGWCWGIPSTVMGITFIAAGTSVPDLITSVIVARQGHGDMAVSSSIGSNVFDILIGLPLPWILWCATNGNVEVVEGDTSLTQSILVLFVMLGAVFVIIVLNRWVLTVQLGYTMFALYLVFLIQYFFTVYKLW